MKTRNSKSEIQCAETGAVAGGRPGLKISRWIRIFSVVLFSCLNAAGSDQTVEMDHPFRFGFSIALMPDVNENDARAAMKVWADAIIKNGAVRADPNVLMFHDFASMSDDLQNRIVDGVATTTIGFFAIQKQVEFNHFVFGATDGSIFDEYVLLVHQDSSLTNIEDLRGRTLNIQKHTRTCLALVWLDTLLMEKGLRPAQDFCGRVNEESKLTQAVLPVFFHKADACLVTRKGFKTMCELNPQVGRQLRVLATSPEFVAAGFFFRTGYPRTQQERCLSEFTRVHTNPTGQQILTVFQTDRLEEHPASVMDSALALLGRHRHLLGETNSLQTTPVSPAHVATNGGVQ